MKCRTLGSTSTQSAVTCASCYDKFVLTKDNFCRNCNSGWASVPVEHQEDLNTPCNSCIEDPAIAGKLVCTKCPTSVDDPNNYNNVNIVNYYTAASGSKRCSKCPDNCMNCDDDFKVCKTCRTGFLLSADKSKCTLCQPSNCADCSDQKGGSGGIPLINYCKKCFP